LKHDAATEYSASAVYARAQDAGMSAAFLPRASTDALVDPRV
jgi:hypothetical protein